jgi:hypothetical protein
MKRAPKSIQTAYIFWLFSGFLAGHRFYIGGWRLAWNLLLLNGGALLLIALALWGEGRISPDWLNTFGGMGALFALFGAFLTMIDLALIPGFVRSENSGEE